MHGDVSYFTINLSFRQRISGNKISYDIEILRCAPLGFARDRQNDRLGSICDTACSFRMTVVMRRSDN